MKKIMTKITEIQIIPIKPINGLVGFASVVLDEKIYLSSIGIHKRLNEEGYRLTYPTRKVGNKSLNIFHPISREVSLAIEQAIITKTTSLFNKKVMNFNARHSYFNHSNG